MKALAEWCTPWEWYRLVTDKRRGIPVLLTYRRGEDKPCRIEELSWIEAECIRQAVKQAKGGN